MNNFTALQQNNNEHQDTNPLQTINNAVAAYNKLKELVDKLESYLQKKSKDLTVAYEVFASSFLSIHTRQLSDVFRS